MLVRLQRIWRRRRRRCIQYLSKNVSFRPQCRAHSLACKVQTEHAQWSMEAIETARRWEMRDYQTWSRTSVTRHLPCSISSVYETNMAEASSNPRYPFTPTGSSPPKVIPSFNLLASSLTDPHHPRGRRCSEVIYPLTNFSSSILHFLP